MASSAVIRPPATLPADFNQFDGAPPAQATAPPQSTTSKVLGVMGDFAKGIGEGAVHTASSMDDFATKHLPAWFTTPIGQTPNAENSAKATQYAKQLEAPKNLTQQIGKGTEQAAEFLVPGAGEERLAASGTNLLSKVPRLAKAAPTIAKIGSSALGAGLVNKAQGGTFTGGAAGGAVGAGVGMGLKAIAPKLAESALNMRAIDRSYGATPGQAILDRTSGFSPSKIVDSARDSLSNVQNLQAAELRDAPGLVSLTPARNIAANFGAKVVEENHPETIKKISNLGDQLHTDYTSKSEIPEMVSPSRAAALNRGISNAKTSWNPATANDTMNAAAGMMHHELGNSIAEVVPSIKPLNQQIQSLMPVVQRGTAADLNAGIVQRSIGRFKAHTGALAASLMGAGYGYAHGGLPSAIGGGLIGLGATEGFSAPETWIAAARAANAPATAKYAIPLMRGALYQAGRDNQ